MPIGNILLLSRSYKLIVFEIYTCAIMPRSGDSCKSWCWGDLTESTCTLSGAVLKSDVAEWDWVPYDRGYFVTTGMSVIRLGFPSLRLGVLCYDQNECNPECKYIRTRRWRVTWTLTHIRWVPQNWHSTLLSTHSPGRTEWTYVYSPPYKFYTTVNSERSLCQNYIIICRV